MSFTFDISNYSTTMESPRMVTAADHWECELQDSPIAGKRHVKATMAMAKPIPFLGERLEKGHQPTSLRPKISAKSATTVFHRREKTSGPQSLHPIPQPSSTVTATGTAIIAVEDDVWPNPFVGPQSGLQSLRTMMEPDDDEMTGRNRNQQRSEAIAIVKDNARRGASPLEDDDTFQAFSSMERQFDLATWRMYARITEHRRRFPVRPYSQQTVNPTSYADAPVPSKKDQDYLTNDQGRLQASNHGERLLDGEIFDLEM